MQAFVLRGIDFFSQSACHIPDEESKDFAIRGESRESDTIPANIPPIAAECISDHGKAICADLGGECVTERDGYYIMSAVCVALGVAILLLYIRPTAKRLQSKPRLPIVLQLRCTDIQSAFDQPCRCDFGVYQYRNRIDGHKQSIRIWYIEGLAQLSGSSFCCIQTIGLRLEAVIMST